jgi:hypothetical protein
VVITTDSSDHSYGGWDSKGHDLQEHWPDSELTLHINHKELLAAKQVTQRLVQEKGQSILIQVDNTVACSYINKQGGRRPQLSHIAESFWDWAIQRGHTLKSTWISTSHNVFADQLTRFHQDRTGWRLTHHVFQAVNKTWGPLQVDLFASKKNTQLPLWISRYPAQGALACNAFQQDWTQWLGLYANPPFNLIGRVLQKVQRQQVELVLITPWWTSAPWWPTLNHLCIEPPLLLPDKPFTHVDPSIRCLHSSESSPSKMLAWRISGACWQGKVWIPQRLHI